MNASCDNKEDYDKDCTCGVESPQVNLEWLKTQLEAALCCEVYSIRYHFKEYIIVSDCPEMRDGMSVMYDCKGTQVCAWGGMYPGSYPCNVPNGFTREYYDKYRKLVFKQYEYRL